ELWALGRPDRVLQASLAARLGEVMSHPIRRDALPPDIKLSFWVRLVPLADGSERPSLEAAEKRGLLTRRTNVLVLRVVKAAFQENLPPEEKAEGRFLSSLLKANCVVDESLTHEARTKAIAQLWAADRYE